MRASPAYGRNAQREYASRAHGSADEFGRGCSDVLRFGLPGHWLERVTHCRERVTHRRTGTLAVVIAHAAGHRHGHGLGASNQVVICLGANAEAASAPLAMTQANADMARLLASLRRQGVQPADISTTELSLYRGYNEPYQASQSVDVTVHHIANAGTVIAAAMNVVGNDATVSGVTYSIHDPSWRSLQLARLRWRTRAWRHSSWRNSLGIRSEQCYLFPMSSSLRDRRAAAAKDAAALEARCHSPQAWIRSRSLST